MLCIYLGEYISGRLLKNKDMCPWDYSDCPLQYQGVIRFDFAPLWFLTGLLFERVCLSFGMPGLSACQLHNQ